VQEYEGRLKKSRMTRIVETSYIYTHILFWGLGFVPNGSIG